MISAPTEPGFYRYSGGRQTILFLLRDGQWFTIFDNVTINACEWGYIEQALGVWDLIPLASESEEVKAIMTVPAFVPGNNRNFERVDGKAVFLDNGDVHFKFFQPESSEAMVDMAKNNIPFQVAFDYRLPLADNEAINSQFKKEVPASRDKIFAAFEEIPVDMNVADILSTLAKHGILLREEV